MRVLEPLLTPELRVLDFGCGAGRLTRHVAPKVAEVICADMSPLLLDEAKQALAGAGNVRFVQTDGATLAGIADESVDLVYAQGVFSFLDPNPMLAALDEIRRVLRPDGHLVFNAYTVDRPAWAARTLSQVRDSARRGRFGGAHNRAYTEPQLRAACEVAGLEVERSVYEGEDLYPGGHLACIVLARRL
ncbi:MAG: class I SAM-dependent methyltransferase [Gaiellaceae bacterium]